jgi:hypothetical protein
MRNGALALALLEPTQIDIVICESCNLIFLSTIALNFRSFELQAQDARFAAPSVPAFVKSNIPSKYPRYKLLRILCSA